MSRHRDLRNLDYDYDVYDDSASGSSFADDCPLSASLEKQFLFRRQRSLSNSSSNGLPVASFAAHGGLSTSQTSESDIFDSSDCRPDLVDECVDRIIAVLQPDLSRSEMATSGALLCNKWSLQTVCDIATKCDAQSELAVNTLLNKPGAFSSSESQQSETKREDKHDLPAELIAGDAFVHQIKGKSASLTLQRDLSRMGGNVSNRATSPDRPRRSPAISTDKSDTDHAAQNLSTSRLTIKTVTPKVVVANSVSNLHDTIMEPSVGGNPTSAVVMRKAQINVSAMYSAERLADNRPRLNMVVCGHVDSGKSTLMGHLMVKLGSVSTRQLAERQREAGKMGKPQQSALAWLLDATHEERVRGVTMDCGYANIQTACRQITLLDAPGHRDFIPNMISGVFQADVAILVVSAARGEFESGFKSSQTDQSGNSVYQSGVETQLADRGQTKEHAMLLRSLGIAHVIVVINKLDTVDWHEERFVKVKHTLAHFLQSLGYRCCDIGPDTTSPTGPSFAVVPASGLMGANLTATDPSLPDWCAAYPPLTNVMDTFFPVPERDLSAPFRMCTDDVFKSAQSSMLSLSGRIGAGYVQSDDKVLLLPANEVVSIKQVIVSSSGDVATDQDHAFAGDHAVLVLQTASLQSATASAGNLTTNIIFVACDPSHPLPITATILGRILVYPFVVRPILPGQLITFQHGAVETPGYISRLIEVIVTDGGERKKRRKLKPRMLTAKNAATVEIRLEMPVCIDVFAKSKSLGRFALRSDSQTIAAGVVTDIVDDGSKGCHDG